MKQWLKFVLCFLAMVVSASAADFGFSWNQLGVDTIAVTRTTKFKKFEHSAGVRLSYDLTDRLGLTLQADGSDFHGTLVDSTFAGVRFGFPMKYARPYLIGGGGWRLQENEEYLAGGGGIEVALGKSIRTYVEFTGEKGVKRDTVFAGLIGVGWRF